MNYMDNLDGYVRKPYIYMLDFLKVMDEYDGIIIAPYQYSCRLMNSSTAWYYGWDCASGCIWNLGCISIKLDSIQEGIQESQEEENVTDLLLRVCSLPK